MTDLAPSLTEYAVLGLLGEGRTHGFAMSKMLGRDGPVGRVVTVRRPLVYRALDRLVDAGLAEQDHTEPGTAGPNRVVHCITDAGRLELEGWLGRPVGHIRDLRIEFQLKLTLLIRSGVSPLQLIQQQQAVLQPTVAALELASETELDHVELWRQHNAAAAGAYLEHLERIYTLATSPSDS